jgi:hypothetical protein
MNNNIEAEEVEFTNLNKEIDTSNEIESDSNIGKILIINLCIYTSILLSI